MAEELIDDLKNYHEAYLICRDLGHAWSENQAVKSRHKKTNVIVRVLNCPRCTKVRIDYYSSKGELVDREYRDPSGYKLSWRPLGAEVRRQRFAAADKTMEFDKELHKVDKTIKLLGRATPRPRSERLKVVG
jgi:hypothetical protein